MSVYSTRHFKIVVRNAVEWMFSDMSDFKSVSYLTLNSFIELLDTFDASQLAKFHYLVDGRYFQLMFGLVFGQFGVQSSAVTYIYPKILEKCAKDSLSMYLLGAADEVIQKVREVLAQSYPTLKIVGFHNGGFTAKSVEGKQALADFSGVISEIDHLKPDVILVSMGGKQHNQEKFVLKYWNELQKSSHVVICVGGLFNRIAGLDIDVPVWVYKLGLEWLVRLFKRPGVTLRRIVGAMKFPWYMLRERMGKV